MFIKSIRLICVLIFLSICSVLSFAKTEIRKIKPPKLESMHLGKKILCYRPMRYGSPNVSVRREGKKIIAHNYGHGGSGWTLAPGATNYVNDLLLNYAGSDLKYTKIIVLY